MDKWATDKWATDKWALLFIIVSLLGIEVGRRFQTMLDLWRRWKGTLAALPGMERDAKSAVRTCIKWGLIILLVTWAASRINTFK